MNIASPAFRFIRRHLRVPVTSLLLACFSLWSTQIKGATVYWDINGTVAGSGGSGAPTGTWDGTNVFFSTDPTGGAGGTLSTWTNGDILAFAAGSNATNAYTVTVAGTQIIGGLIFEEGAVTLTGGTLQLAAASNFDVASNLTGTVNSVVDGGFNLVKTGAGKLVLGGTNTYTGNTLINAGILSISSDASLGTAPGGVVADSINFTGAGTLQVTGTGNPTINANRGITINNTITGTLQVLDAANTVTYGGLITGAAGTTFKKTGAGTLDLQGASGLAGALNVDGGTLKLSGNGTLASTSGVTLGNRATLTLDNNTTNLGDRIAGAFTSAGGTINFIGNAAATTETMGALTLNAGALTINTTAGAGGATLTIPTLTRSVAGGTLYLNGTGLGGATNQVILGTAPALVNSILRYAVVNDGTLASFASYTTSAGTNQSVKPLALASHNQGSETTWASTNNGRPTADVTVTNSRSLYTLTLDNGIDLLAPAADRTITMGGAVLQTGGTSIVDATTTLENILAFGTNEAIFITLGTLQLNRGNTNTLTGTGGFTKSGAGTLILNGVSTLTGTFNHNEGILELRGATSLFTTAATINLNGGTLRFSNDASTTFTGNNLLVNADSAIQVDRVTAAATATTHTAGTLSIGGGRTLSVSSNDITSGTAYGLTTGALTLTAGGATFDVANNGAGTGTLIVGTTSGAFPIVKTGAGDLLTSSITSGFSGPVEIQAGRVGWSGGSLTINESQIFSGAGGIFKNGNVIINLTGANTFTGGVNVTGGILQFSTVSDNGGSASNLGQGTDGITMNGGTLSFIGGISQSTNRGITIATNSTFDASGTGGATITYTGPINAAGLSATFTGTAASGGLVTGGLTQTGVAADITVSSGNWTFSGGTVTVADDLNVVGSTAVLNLNTTGGVAYLGGGTTNTDATLNIQNGGRVNLNAHNTSITDITTTGLDRLYVGQATTGAIAILNTNTFDLTTGRLDLGNFTTGLEGLIDGTGTVTVTTDFNLYRGTINANLAGAGPVEKFGLGTVTLAGNNSGLTSTTAVRVDAGNLILDYATSNTDKLRSATGLDMRGGTLTLNGNASAATSQTVASLTLASGGSNKIDVNSNGFATTLNLGAITRGALANDGTLRIELPLLGGVTTSSANVNGILGGWATVTDSGGVTHFAANDGSGNIVPVTSVAQDNIALWTTGQHISDSTGFSGTMDSPSINSLRFNANAASAVTLNSGSVLNVTTGGILMTSAAATGAHTISGGRLTSGVGELTFTQDSTAQGLTVSSTIAGTNGVTKSGNGILTLSGTNTYSGITDILAGTLIAAGGNAIGDASAVTLADDMASTLQITGNETIGYLAGGNATGGLLVGVVAIGSNTLTINQASSTTYAGVITGNGAIVRNNTSGTGNTLFTGASGSGFTGTVTINGGLFYLEGAATLDATSFTVNKGGSFLISNNGATRSGTRILDTTPIILNSADGAWSGETRPSGLATRTDQNATTTETIGDLTFNSGASYLRGDASGTTGIAGILTNNFVRNNNATVDARARAMGATTGDRISFRISNTTNQTAFIGTLVGGGGAAASKNISIVPWAYGETLTTTLADTNMGNSLVTYVSGAGFRALDLTTEYNTYTASAVATENIRESLTTDLTGLGGKTINALVLNNNNTAASTINFTGTGAGQTLAITAGTMLFTANTGAASSAAMNINVGGFDGGITTAGTSPEYIFFVQNPSSVATTPVVTATINSPLSTLADITKSGRGTLVLTTSNTAGGGTKKTTLNEGVLQIADLDYIGGNTGGLVFAGGTLRLGTGYTDDFSTRTITFLQGGGTVDTNGISLSLAGSLGSGSGTFTKAGAGTLTLNATTTLTGGTIVSAGSVVMGANQAIGTGDLSVTAGATLDMGTFNATVGNVTLPNSATNALTGTGTLTAAGTMTVSRGTISPALAGAFNLIKQTASQTVILSNANNSFTGYTHIQDGTLSVPALANAGVNSSLGAPTGESSVIRLGNTTTTGTLLYTGAATSTDRPFYLVGTTGGGIIDNDGTGALTLSGRIGGWELGTKTLTLQGATTGFNNIYSGSIDQGVAVMNLTKAEAGTWELVNANNYTGVTTVTAGTLQVDTATGGLGNSVAVNAIDLNGGTLSLRNNGAGNNGTIIYGGASSPAGYNVQLTVSGSTINVNNLTANTGNTIQLGPLTQAAALARTLNVTGGNGYNVSFASLGLSPGTGQTTTLNPTTASILITGNVNNPMSGFGAGNFDTLVLDGTSTGNVIDGNISDAVGGSLAAGGTTRLTKSNTSTWTLNGNSTYTGVTSLNAGVLIAGTDTVFGGSIVTFGGGTLNNQDENRSFANDISLNGNGTLTGTGNFTFTSNVSQTGGSRTLAVNNTGVTTIGNASTDNLILAEANQARVLTLNVASTASVIVNATIVDGTGTGADGLTKTGTGPLTINTSSTYTGATTLDAGTTTFTANQNLTAAGNTLLIGSAASVTTPANLDLSAASATFGGAMTMNINSSTASVITIGAAQSLTINNNVQIGATAPAAGTVTKLNLTGGGAFNVTTAAGGSFVVGGSTSTTNGADTTLDLTGLSSTTINTSATGTFRVNNAGGTNLTGGKATLLLPTPAVADTVATTTITTNNFIVGDAGVFNNNAGQINSVFLGTGLTTINANNVNVGTGARDIGQILFSAAGGDLKLRAADGTSRVTTFNIGTGGATTGTTDPTTNNLVDFTGHDADLLISTLAIGNQARTGNLNSDFKFDAGTLDVTSVNLGFRSGTVSATNTLGNTISIGGGTVIFGNAGGTGTGVDVGNSSYTGTGAALTTGIINISGGNVTIYNSTSLGAAVRLGTNAATGGGLVTAALNLTGGTTTLGGNIIRNATSPRTTSSVLLNGASATLDMGGFAIGSSATPITFDVRQGTLKNLGETNGGALLVKTTSGTLIMDGTNTYAGGTAIQDGLVIAAGGGNNRLSTGGVTLGNGTASGVLQLGNAAGTSNQTVPFLETSGTGTANAVVGGNALNSTLTFNQVGTSTYDGRLGGAGTNQNQLNIVKSGIGTQVLTGTSTITGSTAVNAGALFIDSVSAFPATGNTSLTVADGAEFSLRGSGLTSVQSYGFSGTGNVITLGTGTGTATLGFRLDGAYNTQLVLAAGQTMSVAAGSTFQTAVYVDDAPINGQQYVLIDGATAGSLHAGGGTFNFSPVIFNGGSFTYALSNVTLGGTVDRWVITPTAQAAAGDVWWKGDLTGIGTGVWSAATTSGTGFPTNWDDTQSGGVDALVPPDSGSIVHFSATGAANFATTLGANLTIQELIFHSGGTAISVDGNSGLYTLTLGNTIDSSGITMLTGAPNVSISADVSLAQAQAFNITDALSTLTFSRGIGGTGALSINSNGSSAGTMIITGVDGMATYTGATNLVTGRLILNGGTNNRLPTTTALTMGNATLSSTLQLGDAVNGSLSQTIAGLNTGAATANSIVGGGATVSTLTIVQGTNGVFNGVIGGAGTNENNLAIVKSGSADLVLNGVNTYAGGTTVTRGLLKLGSTAAITGALTINAEAGATAIFDNNSRPTVLTGGITFSGADSAAAPQLIDTGGGGSITLGGDVVYTGTNNPVAVSVGLPLNLGAASRIFTANDSTTAATDLTLAGNISTTAGNVGANGVGLTLDGSGSGLITGTINLVNGTADGASVDLTKNGTGTWTVQNTVTISDDYLINAGTFAVSGAGSLTWNATGSTSQDFVADTTALTVNFNVANSIVGNANTNRIFSRDGATINVNASGAFGGTMETIVLGDDNQGIGNIVFAAGTTNTLNNGTLQVGFNSSGEVGNVTGTGTLAGVTTFTLNNGTVSANITGVGNITRDNNLTATLSGNNTLTGTTLNREGTLILDYATYAGSNNKIGTGAMTVGSSTNNDATAITNFLGNASASSSQTVASLAVAGGPSQINLTSNGGQDMIFNVTGAITRTAGTLNVTLPNANTQFTYSGPTTNTNGMVGAWLTLNDRDYASISGGQLVAATYTTANNASTWHSPTANITNSAAFTGTLSSTCYTINSLRFDAAAASSITVGSTLVLSSGGLMVNASVGNNASTITGGTIASGLSTGELIITQNNTANVLTIASRVINSAPITKNGTGTLVLSGVNNQTGTINIDEGIIRVTGGSAISDTSTINIRNVANTGLELAASQTETIGSLLSDGASSVVIVNTGATLTINQTTAGTMAGIISGAGNLVKNGTATLTVTNDASISGTLTINAGRITLSGASGRINDSSSYTLNGGELFLVQDQSASADRIRDTQTITLNNTGGGSGLRLQNTNQNATRSDNIGPIALGFGHNIVTADALAATGTASVADLVADTLSRGSNRATLLVSGLNLGSTATVAKGFIRFDAGGQTALNGFEVGGGASSGTNISVIPWMIGDLTTAGLGNTFVTNVDGTTGLRPLASTEYINDSTAITGTLTDNIRYTATAAIASTPTAINSLVLDASSNIALTGSASSMEITTGAILAAGAGNHSIGTISGITTGGGRDYTVFVTTAASNLTLNSPLTTAVPLVKSGAGTLTLTNAANAFTDVYFNQGAIAVNGLDKLGTGTLNFYGGTLRLNTGFVDDVSTRTINIGSGGGTLDTNGLNTTFANGIKDSTPSTADIFQKAGDGALTIQGSSTFTGTFIVNHMATTTAAGTATVTLNGATNAAINGNIQIGSTTLPTASQKAVVVLGNSEQIVNTAIMSFNGSSGEESYFRLSGYTETLAAISDTTGRGVIENVSNAEVVSTNGRLVVNSASDFSYNGFLRNRGSGSNTTVLEFEKQGTGVQTLSGANIIYTGTTTVTGGTLRLTDTTAFASNVVNNATLDLNRTTGTWTMANTISGTGNVEKTGAGTVVLSGGNSYSGTTTIEQGVLSISASNHLGDGSSTNNIRIADNATLQSTGANVDLGANRTISFAGLGGTIDVTSTNRLTVSGVLAGDDCHTLTKTGTGVLSLTGTSNTFAGAVNVTAGSLQVGSGGVGSSGTGLITVSSAATLAGTGTIQGNVTIASGGTLQAGDVTTAGASPVTNNGTLTFTPSTTLTAASGSTIRLDITSSTNSVVDPDWGGNSYGSAGWISYVTSFNNQGGDHDRLILNGGVSLATGAEIIVNGVGFTPLQGQIFNLFDWVGIVGFAVGTNTRDGSSDGGATDDLNLPDISSSGLQWDISQFQAHGIVAVVPEPSRALLLGLGVGLAALRRRRPVA